MAELAELAELAETCVRAEPIELAKVSAPPHAETKNAVIATAFFYATK